MPHCHARFVAITAAAATVTTTAAVAVAVTTTIAYWIVSCVWRFDTGAGTVPLTLPFSWQRQWYTVLISTRTFIILTHNCA